MVDVACSVTSYSDDDSSVRQAARVNDDVTADVTDDVTDDGNTMSAITCCLETKELWEQFHQLGTEMIITKSGRYTLHTYTTLHVPGMWLSLSPGGLQTNQGLVLGFVSDGLANASVSVSESRVSRAFSKSLNRSR